MKYRYEVYVHKKKGRSKVCFIANLDHDWRVRTPEEEAEFRRFMAFPESGKRKRRGEDSDA